ncbi:hypothetical protein ABK040_011400 [Willaertia magna]
MENRIIFRLQDGMSKVIDGRSGNFVSNMSERVWKKFVDNLKKFVMLIECINYNYVKDHGDIINFYIHSIKFSLKSTKILPPLYTTNW